MRASPVVGSAQSLQRSSMVGTCAQTVPATGARLFRFGLLSDVQHADIDDGASFHGTPRYYREALVALDRAVSSWQESSVDFAVHMGDIIDYHNTLAGTSDAALQNVLAHFDRLGRPVLHMLGNHCLYNHPRPQLNAELGIHLHQGEPAPAHSYYAYKPHPQWRFIVLDGYDVSILGWPPGHPLHEQATALLAANNPNENKNSAAGLEGPARRFVQFGGGLSKGQLAWLEAQLAEARVGGERVIVACHLCFHPETCPPACLNWSYEQVLETLQRYPDVVVATLAGHAHADGEHRDAAGINHRVCKAVLETPPGRDCFALVDVYSDRVVVKGVDTFASTEWAVLPAAEAVAATAAREEEKGRTGGLEAALEASLKI